MTCADPTSDYARKVISGEIIAGRLVRLACQRHLNDLETGEARGLRFDLAAAKRALDFFGFLTLGDGKPFVLQPFQQFKTGCLFGWKRDSGHRRFRTAYIEESKGAGKTPWASATLLYLLIADGKTEAECYCAAVTREQASIAFRDARNLASSSPAMSRILDISQHNIAFLKTSSFLRPVSSEHRGLDGKRVHGAIIDEIHEHPTALVADKIDAGTKADLDALIIEITNSGYDRQSVCWHHRERSRNILEGREEADSWFAYVCTLDPCKTHLDEGKQQPVEGCAECDDWHDEKVWPKVNPGVGSILPYEYLRNQVASADGMPSKEGIVKRLNFCLWTESITQWLPAALWSRGAAPIHLDSLRRKPCWAGLDLASRSDLTAFVLIFRERPPHTAEVFTEFPEGEAPDSPAIGPKTPYLYRIVPYFWIPRERALERERKDRVPYLLWASRGLIRFTEGDTTDYGIVENFIKEQAALYELQEVAYDPWNATQTALNLQSSGIKMVEFGQSLRNFNEPTKEFEALLKAGRLLHGGHAVLDWNAANAAVKTDPSANIRPVKPDHNQAGKVDGVVAAVMALGRAMLTDSDGEYDPSWLRN